MRSSESVQIIRPRLLDELLAHPIGLIEAGAGYGKSVLASQHRQALGIATAYVPLGPPDRDAGVLTGSLRRGLSQAQLSDLLAVTGAHEPTAWIERLLDALSANEDPVLLIIDDAHHLQSEPSAHLVLRLARGLPAPHRMLVAARSFSRALEPVWALPEPAHLDSQALTFTLQETRSLLALRGLEAGEREAQVLLETTGGWATALVLAVAATSLEHHDPRPLSDGDRDPVAAPLRRMLDALAPADRDLAVQLAHLPLLSVELCDAAAGRDGAFETLVAGGVPMARSESGWWELPSPVAAHLATQAPARPETMQAAAGYYRRGGAEVAALRVLAAGGLTDAAAASLAEFDPSRVQELGLGVVRDLIESLPVEAVEAQPRSLLHLARLAETAHQPDLRTGALDRAASAVPDDGPLRREIDAERARDLIWDERTRAESQALASSVVQAAGPDEAVARARALDVLGRLGSWFSSSGPQSEAEGLLRESARLCRRLRQPTWTAQALAALGAGYFFALCRYDEALEVLGEALGELPARSPYRAMIQSFRADALVELAQWEEAEAAIASMREIGAAAKERWILAYAAWLEAALASYQGDGERTVLAYREIDRHHDEWFDQPSGGECLAQVADHLSRAGQAELALECLERARGKMEGNERIVRVHGAAVLARSGDLDEAEAAIRDALEGPAAEPHELWPLHLQRAYVALRRGDPRAGELAAGAFELCGELGHPEGPLVRERVLAERLLPLAVDAGSAVATGLALRRVNDTWSVRLLGGFEVRRHGIQVDLPSGRPARAVRIIAASGGRLHAETLMEMLWPDAPVDLGRVRLRNLLSRLRLASGELLRREGQMLALASACEIDATWFEQTAIEALSATSARNHDRAVRLACVALERYRGELLPDDRYEPWAEAPRERLRVLQLELLDLVSAAAEQDGDIDEARRLITRAIDAEPRDAHRYVQLARLLAAQGRSGSALNVVRQARAALAADGLLMPPELERLARSYIRGSED